MMYQMMKGTTSTIVLKGAWGRGGGGGAAAALRHGARAAPKTITDLAAFCCCLGAAKRQPLYSCNVSLEAPRARAINQTAWVRWCAVRLRGVARRNSTLVVEEGCIYHHITYNVARRARRAWCFVLVRLAWCNMPDQPAD